MKKVTIVGCGYATRKMHLYNIAEVLNPDLVYVVDLLQERANMGVKILKEMGIGAEAVVKDFTEMFDFEKNKVRIQDHPALNVDYSILATLSDGGPVHTPLARVFDEVKVPIFSEKPLSRNREELKIASEVSVLSQVDYLEVKNPAYLAVLGDVSKSNFRPRRGFHVRSMWDPTGKSYMHIESGHDISEIIVAHRKLGLDETPVVSVIKIDNQIPEKYVELRLLFRDSVYEILGSHLFCNDKVGEESAMRYFAWTDDNVCYLGNTLLRDYIEPFAVKFGNGREVFEELRSGLFFDRVFKDSFIKKHDSVVLETQKYEEIPSKAMLEEFVCGRPSVNIPFTIGLEKILYDAYDMVGTQPQYRLWGQSLLDIRSKHLTQRS